MNKYEPYRPPSPPEKPDILRVAIAILCLIAGMVLSFLGFVLCAGFFLGMVGGVTHWQLLGAGAIFLAPAFGLFWLRKKLRKDGAAQTKTERIAATPVAREIRTPGKAGTGLKNAGSILVFCGLSIWLRSHDIVGSLLFALTGGLLVFWGWVRKRSELS